MHNNFILFSLSLSFIINQILTHTDLIIKINLKRKKNRAKGLEI